MPPQLCLRRSSCRLHCGVHAIGTVTIVAERKKSSRGGSGQLISLFEQQPTGTAQTVCQRKVFSGCKQLFLWLSGLAGSQPNQGGPPLLLLLEEPVQRGIPAMLRLLRHYLFPNGHHYGSRSSPRCSVKPEHPGNLHGSNQPSSNCIKGLLHKSEEHSQTNKVCIFASTAQTMNSDSEALGIIALLLT